ncbi:fungal chitosanase of glycosyl hydrolase group 75-domain-containing protein [Mycena polygramma]|nr:fungal chitosanase of glycosyl hydrolase group 75-domain-containing protein [Mycena polygramma]
MSPSTLFVFSTLISFVVAAPLFNLATRAVGFTAAVPVDIAGILLAAQASTQALATFPHNAAAKPDVPIFGDWVNLEGVSAFHFFADMDVDCDGVAGCSDDPTGQPQTSFGHLDAAQVPYFVLPADFLAAHEDTIKPNALGAIICDKQVVYGIFGDTNGATPQVIGEGSLLLAQTCFPKEGLSASNGHTPLDVLYIVFGTTVTPNVGDSTISIPDLQKFGDEQIEKLQTALKL